MRLIELVETFLGGILGFVGDIWVVESPVFAIVSKPSSKEAALGFYPFRPAATFLGSLSGVMAASPERTSLECSLDSADVSELVRERIVKAERVFHLGC